MQTLNYQASPQIPCKPQNTMQTIKYHANHKIPCKPANATQPQEYHATPKIPCKPQNTIQTPKCHANPHIPCNPLLSSRGSFTSHAIGAPAAVGHHGVSLLALPLQLLTRCFSSPPFEKRRCALAAGASEQREVYFAEWQSR